MWCAPCNFLSFPLSRRPDRSGAGVPGHTGALDAPRAAAGKLWRRPTERGAPHETLCHHTPASPAPAPPHRLLQREGHAGRYYPEMYLPLSSPRNNNFRFFAPPVQTPGGAPASTHSRPQPRIRPSAEFRAPCLSRQRRRGNALGVQARNKLKSFLPETAFSAKILLAERASSICFSPAGRSKGEAQSAAQPPSSFEIRRFQTKRSKSRCGAGITALFPISP